MEPPMFDNRQNYIMPKLMDKQTDFEAQANSGSLRPRRARVYQSVESPVKGGEIGQAGFLKRFLMKSL
jgi:hypothetical protein